MKKKRIMAAMAVLTMTLVAGAQTNDGYFVGKNYVSYCDSLMSGADAATFVDLGHGYAKDKSHVYKDGGILSFVDPATFAVKDATIAAVKPKKDKTATADKRQEANSSDGDDGNTAQAETGFTAAAEAPAVFYVIAFASSIKFHTVRVFKTLSQKSVNHVQERLRNGPLSVVNLAHQRGKFEGDERSESAFMGSDFLCRFRIPIRTGKKVPVGF